MNSKYPMVIRAISPEDGGGYSCEFPDLPGCIGDGDTPVSALEDGLNAANAWLEVHAEMGLTAPIPNSSVERSLDKLRSLVKAINNLLEFNGFAFEHIEACEDIIKRLTEKLMEGDTGLIVSAEVSDAKQLLARH